MACKHTKLEFMQGDDVSFKFIHEDSDGNPINLSGATIESQIRSDYEKDVVASFVVVYDDLASGEYSLTLTKAITSAITVKGKQQLFVFDVEVTYNNGTRKKATKGTITIGREVTR